MLSDEEIKDLFEKWASEQYRFSTAEEASEFLPFDLKIPKSKATEKLAGIYVTKNEDKYERWAYIVYEPPAIGIYVEVKYPPNKPDFAAEVKQMEEDKKAGISKGDQPWVLVTVHGLEGIGCEPGYNLIHGQKYPRPGFVSWWDNGVLYTIFGTRGENGTSLDTLIGIAESMYEE